MKTRIVAAVIGTAAVVILQSNAFADFIEWPVKWSQPIGTNLEGVIIGTDRTSDHSIPWIMADDYQCNDPLPIMAVRWWGSYVGETMVRPTGFVVGFDFNIYGSTGTPANHPNSLPVGAPVYTAALIAQEEFVGVDQTGDNVYRYDAFLAEPFDQVFGTEYFISIDKPTGEQWGWHDSGASHPILDWAAFTPVGHGGPWVTFNPHTDLAFELMVPEPNTTVLALIGGGLLMGVALRRRG
jgi:hypothetical protein